MFGLTRIQIYLLTVLKLMLCWHPAFGEFTHETCMELNATANITCTESDYSYLVAFTNEEHLKINASPYEGKVIIACTAEHELGISGNVPKLQLGQLNGLEIDGCLPFDDIFQQLGINIGRSLTLRQGRTTTQLKRHHLAHLSRVEDFELVGFSQLDEDVLADMVGLTNINMKRLEGTLPGGLLTSISAQLLRLPAGLFAKLNHLNILDLSKNELNTITSGTFENLYNLTELNLSNNLLTHVPADLFHSLGKLDSLDISNNRLKELELGTFATLSNLKYLDMRNNELDLKASTACSIFDGLTNLRYWDIRQNSLSVFCLPHQMSSVRIVASDNQISELLVPIGKHQPRQLVLLDVRRNRLQHLSAGILQYLHDSKTELLLRDNPWQCGCESVLLLNFIKQNSELVIDLTELRCADGRTVEEVIELSPSDICKQLQQWYYIAANAVLTLLAVAALTAAWLHKRTARRNKGK